jgi:uncharacterized membrane protein YbhN (UPF0104 family)
MRARSSTRAALARVLPWAVAAAILWLLLTRIDASALLAGARDADLRVFVPAVLSGVAAWFLLESAAFAYLFSRFNAPLTWREARSLRALTYLLTPINWNLGTAAIILHLRRSKGIPALDATSSLALYGLIDALALFGLTAVGVAAQPSSPGLRTMGWVARGLLAAQIAFLVVFVARWPRQGWATRLRSLRLFRSHARATWRDVGVLLAIRAVYFAGFVVFFWAGARAFGVAAPLAHMAAVVPVILMVAAIPITPAGLGTQQAAMLALLAPYGSEAEILAFGLAYPVALVFARLPLAALYSRDLAALRSAVRGARAV